MREEIRAWIQETAEPGYRQFSAKLLPEGVPIQGVRLPTLRKKAKELVRDGCWQAYLEEYWAADESWFEEDMLAGFCIGGARMETEERIRWMRRFEPRVSNWSVCDSFCVSLKAVEKEREGYWPLITEWIHRPEEFAVRLGAVLLLDHYRVAEWSEKAVELLASITHSGYYAQMGTAWALAEFYLDFPEQTRKVLRQYPLQPEILQKTIRKLRESRRSLSEDWGRLTGIGEVSP